MEARDVASVGAVFVIAGCLYLLLAGQLSLSEIIAGAAVALLAAGFAAALLHAEKRRLRFPAGSLPAALRGVGAMLPDALRVGRMILARDPAGQLVHQTFRPGGDDPADAGRRAVVTLATSLAPNQYVVCMGEDLLVHRLAPGPSRDDPDWPV